MMFFLGKELSYATLIPILLNEKIAISIRIEAKRCFTVIYQA